MTSTETPAIGSGKTDHSTTGQADSGAPEGAITQETPESAKTPEAPAEPAKPDEAGTPEPDGAKPPDAAAVQKKAPETYQPFTLPENTVLHSSMLKGLEAQFRAMDLSQEQAQAFISEMAKGVSDVMSEASKANELAIANEHGDKTAELKAARDLILARYGDDAVRSLLKTRGLDDDPAMFRFLAKLGEQISPDRFMPSGGTPAAPKEDNWSDPRTTIKRLYPEEQ